MCWQKASRDGLCHKIWTTVGVKRSGHVTMDKNHRKRLINDWFVYALNAVHALLALLPPPLRWLGFKLMLGRLGEGVHFDYRVYFKYPWLVEIGSDVSVNRGVEFYPGLYGGKARIL